MKQICLILLGGFFGTVLRVLLTQAIQRRFGMSWPVDIFLINLSGALVLGFFATMIEEGLTIPPTFRLFFATGFLGAYTTFSSFEYGTATLLATGHSGAALAYFLATLGIGLAAVYLGRVLARSAVQASRSSGVQAHPSPVSPADETLHTPEGEGE